MLRVLMNAYITRRRMSVRQQGAVTSATAGGDVFASNRLSSTSRTSQRSEVLLVRVVRVERVERVEQEPQEHIPPDFTWPSADPHDFHFWIILPSLRFVKGVRP